ncbi:helix-turn-helix domain-containing protein [Bacillus sp. ISL-47]|uniref:helix-turn-helix domain-containing protein n=1 Tax=Bacillus sp. ISL-47 TaxID=2819130 RepID=UPI001BEA9D05|nr:helix-turn-helix domain-containing protein [Bacillus sp. ISL-47]MBT2690984.1 helix-turn-helix domain-containing protein [Bacillus sp. ISL-47]MBT2710403.1 helix-turn-helix domain-containing protein [Pseudomonas sp. ISL-84]
MGNNLLTVPEVAKILSVSSERAYSLARRGILPTVKIGRQIRVDEGKLNDWIDKGGSALQGGWKHSIN